MGEQPTPPHPIPSFPTSLTKPSAANSADANHVSVLRCLRGYAIMKSQTTASGDDMRPLSPLLEAPKRLGFWASGLHAQRDCGRAGGLAGWLAGCFAGLLVATGPLGLPAPPS